MKAVLLTLILLVPSGSARASTLPEASPSPSWLRGAERESSIVPYRPRPVQVAFLRRIGRAFGRVARGIGRAAGRIASTVGRAIGRAGRAVGTAVRKVGRAVGRVARRVGRAVGKVAKVVGKAAKKVGKVVKKVGKAVLKGLKTLAQFVAKLGKKVLEKIKRFLTSKLGGMVLKYLPKIMKFVGKVWGGKLKWLATLTKIVDAAAKVQAFLQKYVAKPLEVLDRILGKRHYLTYARDPNQLINAAKDKLKSWVTEKIMGLLMGLLNKLARQVTEALIALGLKILKHPITTAIATWITTAVASATSGVGALLKPIIKWAIDKLMDKWAIPKLAQLLVGKAVSKVESWLREKVLPKFVDKPIDRIVDHLVSKYLQKWIDKYKDKTGKFFDKVEGFVDRIRGLLDKVWAGLRTVDRAVDVLRKIRDAYRETVKGKVELCRALAIDYQAAKTDVRRLRDKPGLVDAMLKVVMLRKSYEQNQCQYGRYY